LWERQILPRIPEAEFGSIFADELLKPLGRVLIRGRLAEAISQA
jgi:hypothetical protein